MLEMGWRFDYVTNISESDFPLRPIAKFEEYLRQHYGHNFVSVGGSDMTRFHAGQGMRKLFYTCDGHMYRLGNRYHILKPIHLALTHFQNDAWRPAVDRGLRLDHAS